MISSLFKSKRQPKTDPPCQIGRSCEKDFALCQISFLQPSKAMEYASSPIP